MNPKVDFFFNKAGKWQDAFEQLRSIILNCGLTEELKWGVPCYTSGGKNILLMHGFKEYCAILFFKGVLLKYANDILVQQTKNVQAGRQIRFTKLQQITDLKATVEAYVYEAIAIEEAGLAVELKKTTEFTMPEEFKYVLKEDHVLKNAFDALTPGRQRAYLLYFAQPKQTKTRESRIAKSISQIMEGKGLND